MARLTPAAVLVRMDMSVWLIGIDDTDVVGTRGTGRLARMLADKLAEWGLRRRGITRHQLLVHPDVPYTTHNSSACLAVEGNGSDEADAFERVCSFVAENSPQGADPGVCMAAATAVTGSVVAFGRRAQTEVVRLADAKRTGREEGLLHAGLGGTNDGMIGALAAVGLRTSGDDGRFIQLGEIREVGGAVRVRRLLDAGIDEVRCPDGQTPALEDVVETLDWVRPRLLGERAVLLVKRSTGDATDWIIADRGERKNK